MAGNLRCELTSAGSEDTSFMGSHHNGHKGKHVGATLDRSGSFREGSDSRLPTSGGSTPRASTSSVGDLPPLNQYLLLDPISLGDQKYSRLGDLRRALGISIGSEDNAFGAAHSKLPAPTEELRRIRGSIHDSFLKARFRTKMLTESLARLHSYSETLCSKKLQRNELTNERSGGPNFLKIRNPADIGNQRLEDRTKNINKRVRSSAVDLRADSRSNTPARQPMVTGKERKDGAEAFDLAEEKPRMLPAGGEGWERKMKRKRSVGSVLTRTMDMEGGDVKRAAYEPGLPPFDSQGLGSVSLNGAGNSGKADRISSPASSIPRAITKNEREKVFLMKDVAAGTNKERLTAKATNKVNIMEDDHMASPSPVTKAKASRAPRTGSVLAGNTLNFPRTGGDVEGWDQTHSANKVNSVGSLTSRKRSLAAGSSSSPMQWATQRQKTPRCRRANVVSPVSNNDELQLSLEGGSVTDFPSRGTSGAINGPLLPKYLANGPQQTRMRCENVSPARLSESEESVPVENGECKSKERGNGSGDVDERSLNPNVGPSVLLKKKNKILNKEDVVDGVRRQGRTGRGASSARATVEILKVKSENITPIKPVRSSRPASDKNGSKSGRPPLKKNSDRKAVVRLGQVPAGSSPDFTGESDDDREELLAAVNFACNSSYLSSSGPFWKKMEPLFGRICLEDLCYLDQQLRSTEETDNLSGVQVHCKDSSEALTHGETQSHPDLEERGRSLHDQVHPTKLGNTLVYEDQEKDDRDLHDSLEERNKITSLYQKVLSALIMEDEFEEVDASSQFLRDSFGEVCQPVDFELRNGNEAEIDSMVGFQTHKLSSVDGYACNGDTVINGFMGTHNQFCNGDVFEESSRFRHLNSGTSRGRLESNAAQPAAHINNPGISALDCQYVQMYLEEKLLMELQSIGLDPESVPDLADGEEESIDRDISELQNVLNQQVTKKKAYLSKVLYGVERRKEADKRATEEVAMDKLVELAYKKLLATKGSYASKNKVPKVSKQAAIGIIKRTLHRCRNFEDPGKSCFTEPELRDILFATPPRGNDPQPMSCVATPATENRHPETPNSQQESGLPKKKEVLLDEVGGSTFSIATASRGHMLQGGAKGKRSERGTDKGTMGRNTVTKGGRAPHNNTKGDRKPKSKPRQKTGQLSTSGDGNVMKLKETNADGKIELESAPHGSNPKPSSKEDKETTNNTELQELESFELGDGNQDLNGWFNFELDGLLPESDLAGLDIPMDDLADLNMLM